MFLPLPTTVSPRKTSREPRCYCFAVISRRRWRVEEEDCLLLFVAERETGVGDVVAVRCCLLCYADVLLHLAVCPHAVVMISAESGVVNFASEDLKWQPQSLELREAHVVEDVAAAPPAHGVAGTLRFRQHVVAVLDLTLIAAVVPPLSARQPATWTDLRLGFVARVVQSS
ncbi:hypothetical protein ACFXTH_022517 [Malus domestica]